MLIVGSNQWKLKILRLACANWLADKDELEERVRGLKDKFVSLKGSYRFLKEEYELKAKEDNHLDRTLEKVRSAFMDSVRETVELKLAMASAQSA